MANGHVAICTSDLLQVNDSVVMPLGEMKGYAPFSPDENSLVLFEGRTALGRGPGRVLLQQARGRRVSPLFRGPSLEEGLIEDVALTHMSSFHPRG